MNAGRIDEHDLRVWTIQHATNLRTGGLRLVGGDGHLLPKNCIEKSRLAHIGTANDGHETRFH